MALHAQDPVARDVAEINIIPLADVLLVLLIIFMVTAPATTRAIGLDLPGRQPDAAPTVRAPLELRIDAVGDVYRGNDLLPMRALQALLEAESVTDPQRPLRLDASDEADYAVVAQVLATAQRAGMSNIAFAGGT